MDFSESLGRIKHSLGFRLYIVGLLLSVGVGAASWVVNPPSSLPAYADKQGRSVPTANPVQRIDGAWEQLSDRQQKALLPLKSMWPTLSVAQQDKWRLIASSFQSKSTAEQQRIRSRMEAWARLTPQQQAQARLAFLEGATTYDRRQRVERWNAYRHLPPDQRPKVAAASNPRIVSRATLRAASGATTMLMPQFFPLPIYGQVAQARASGQQSEPQPDMVLRSDDAASTAITPSMPTSMPAQQP